MDALFATQKGMLFETNWCPVLPGYISLLSFSTTRAVVEERHLTQSIMMNAIQLMIKYSWYLVMVY